MKIKYYPQPVRLVFSWTNRAEMAKAEKKHRQGERQREG
jgi:hypothetical protein